MVAITDTNSIATIEVSPTQSREAIEVTRQIGQVDPRTLRIRIESGSGEEVVLPSDLSALLQSVLKLSAAGHEFELSQFPKALTSVEAAKMLGVSRPTLLKMAANGELPSHKVGSHTRFARSDLKQFALKRLAERQEAFDELRLIEDNLQP